MDAQLLETIEAQRREIIALKRLLKNHLELFKELLEDTESTREMLGKIKEIVR